MKMTIQFLLILLTANIFLFRCMSNNDSIMTTTSRDEPSELTPPASTPRTVEPTAIHVIIDAEVAITDSLDITASLPSQLPPISQENEPDIPDRPEPSIPGEIDQINWQTYQNDSFGFQIEHPNNIETIIPNPASQVTSVPQSVAEILFQDKRLAQRADLEPSEFTIRIFKNEAGEPIEEWLQRHKLAPREGGWQTEPYSLNALPSVRVYSENFIAPGWFIYVTNGQYVYQLTPLGAVAEQMLATFSFTN